MTARLLGFEGPSPSSIDAVSDRDSAWESLFALAMVHLHASQLAEELVIGAMPESGRVRLSEAFVTTSSLMPHKRNPDLAELVRAESAGAIGRLTQGLALVRSLPIGYQRDLQAGKPPLFEGFVRLGRTLSALAPMVAEAEYLSPPTAASRPLPSSSRTSWSGPACPSGRRTAAWADFSPSSSAAADRSSGSAKPSSASRSLSSRAGSSGSRAPKRKRTAVRRSGEARPGR